ncbi:MAG: Prolipoprotein diacylglyceryl transferase [Chlamydiae bacterium]|nr:Prolipoprotein diacylglyceryl transferase [Chlamydiota bacterium]
MSFYVVIGTLFGARLGEAIFYQTPMQFVQDPMGIFRFWEPGLSSHGGVIGILLGLWIFCYRIRKKYPMITWIALLDLLSIPALLAGAFIRIGNFFNQEILGVPTKMPWGVIFGHPLDGSSVVARHPVQLYEALFYFVFFIVLWTLRSRLPRMFRLGKTSGLFFMGTFGFRFIIEFLKMPQSLLLSSSGSWHMGQILSIPMIAIGVILFFGYQNSFRARVVEGN